MKKTLLFLLLISGTFYGQAFEAVRNVIKAANNKTEMADIRYSALKDGEELYSVIRRVPYDTPLPGAAVNNNGTLFLVYSIDASVEIINSNGVIVTKAFFYEEPKIEYERAIYAVALGNLIAAAVSEPSLPNGKIILLSEEGRAVKKIDIIEKNIGMLASSVGGKYFSVSAYAFSNEGVDGRTYFFDSNGDKLFAFNSYYTSGSFVKDEKLFLAYDKSKIEVMDFLSGKSVDSFKLKEGKILSAKFAAGVVFVLKYEEVELSNGEWNYLYPKLIKVSRGKAESVVEDLPSRIKSFKWNGSGGFFGIEVK